MKYLKLVSRFFGSSFSSPGLDPSMSVGSFRGVLITVSGRPSTNTSFLAPILSG